MPTEYRTATEFDSVDVDLASGRDSRTGRRHRKRLRSRRSDRTRRHPRQTQSKSTVSVEPSTISELEGPSVSTTKPPPRENRALQRGAQAPLELPANCWPICMKLSSYGLSILLALSGMLLICLGVVLMRFLGGSGVLVQERYSTLPIAFIVFGVGMFLAAALGCCAICQDNNCLITTFVGLLILLICAEAALSFWGVVYTKALDRTTAAILKESIQHYFDRANFFYRHAWDDLQTQLLCCGVNNSVDWIVFGEIPESCGPKPYQQPGCLAALLDQLHMYITLAVTFYCALCVLEFVGISCVCCLGCQLSSGKKSARQSPSRRRKSTET